MKSKTPGKVWMRMGDNGDYEDFDSMFDAGDRLGNYYAATDLGETPTMPDIINSSNTGVVAPGFEGYNYISLFWGDNDAQLTKGHTKADLAEFKRGVREGLGIPWTKRERKITHGITSRKTSTKKSGPSGFGGVR